MTTLSRPLGGLLGGGIVESILGADVSGSWTPKSPTKTLLEWQKSDAGIIASNGSQFSPWSDQSGAGKDMVQATGSNRPVYKTNSLNSLPVVSFNRTASEVMASALSAVGLGALTIALVMRPQDLSVGGGCWAWQPALTSGTPFILCAIQDSTHLKFFMNSGYNITNVPQVAGAAHAYILTWTGSLWTLYQDGASIGTYSGGGSNQSTASGLYIGNGFGGYTTVDFAELIVYGGVLGASDITSMSSYLRRWGTP